MNLLMIITNPKYDQEYLDAMDKLDGMAAPILADQFQNIIYTQADAMDDNKWPFIQNLIYHLHEKRRDSEITREETILLTHLEGLQFHRRISAGALPNNNCDPSCLHISIGLLSPVMQAHFLLIPMVKCKRL